ncbi:MAG: GAF domain-containing protein [Candidatus Methylomirabilales bacterium]
MNNTEHSTFIQASEQKVTRLTTLMELSTFLNSTLETKEVLRRSMEAIVRLMECEGGSLLLVDEEAQELVFEVALGEKGEKVKEIRLKIGEGIAGWVAKQAKPLILNDVGQDPRFFSGADEQSGFKTRNMVCIPVLSRGKVIGVLQGLNKLKGPSFTEEDGELLAALGNHVAIALENARLFQKVEERTRALKEAQEELVKKEKLAVLGQLAGGVGHELRNPLGVMKNSIYFLKMRFQDGDEKSKRHMSIIDREIGTANKIITDLLDFSRIKEPTRVNTDLNELVQEILAQYPVDQEVQVHTEFDPNLPSVSIDKDQIRQVLLNMIMNGAQAMPDGGRLTIKTSVDQGFVDVSFTDVGCGIPEENLEKIFQPLFTTKAKGVGRGLAVSMGLARANDADITVESQVGRGTTFHVTFPTN